MIRDRLAEVGIEVLIEGEGNPRTGGGLARDIYVDDGDLERARETLKAIEQPGGERTPD